MKSWTSWLKNEFESLEDASSAQTYACIQKARKASAVPVFLIKLASLLVCFALIAVAGKAFGIELFAEVSGWVLGVAAALAAHILAEPFADAVIKSKLRKIVRASE